MPARPGFARFFAAPADLLDRWLVLDVRLRSGVLVPAGVWLDRSLLATWFALD